MPLYTGEDIRIANAATAGEQAHRRHASSFMAKPQAEQDAWWAEQEKLSAMRRRAKIAYQSGRPAPKRRRDFADPPLPNRQYATIETTIFRDPRMSKTEAAALTIIVAWAGTAGQCDFTHGQLGEKLNRSRSTMKRVVKNLKDREYLGVEILRYPNGKARCLRLRPTDKAWPFWHSHRQDPSTPPCGSTPAPPITTSLKEEETMERSMDADDEAFLRSILAVHPQVKMSAEESGVSIAQAVESSIRLIAAGRLRLEDGPEGSRLVPLDANGKPPAMPKPKKRRLFRP